MARDRGYRLSNADVTLICEAPKIGPHAGDMQGELARILGIEADRVSVKATTSERLGFTGRERGDRRTGHRHPGEAMTLPRLIATLFGIGLLRPAPGTWGSAVAVAAGLAIDHTFGFAALVVATVAVTLLGFWAVAGATAGQPDKDPSEIVIDEVAGQWLALLFPAAAFWSRGMDGLVAGRLAGLGRGLRLLPALRHLETQARSGAPTGAMMPPARWRMTSGPGFSPGSRPWSRPASRMG